MDLRIQENKVVSSMSFLSYLINIRLGLEEADSLETLNMLLTTKNNNKHTN